VIIGPARLARSEHEATRGPSSCPSWIGEDGGDLDDFRRSGMRDVTALTVPHRFKVKAFSSIWNARTQRQAGGTPTESRFQNARASVGPLALHLLWLSMRQSAVRRKWVRRDVNFDAMSFAGAR
jgi:hypothetical protein